MVRLRTVELLRSPEDLLTVEEFPLLERLEPDVLPVYLESVVDLVLVVTEDPLPDRVLRTVLVPVERPVLPEVRPVTLVPVLPEFVRVTEVVFVLLTFLTVVERSVPVLLVIPVELFPVRVLFPVCPTPFPLLIRPVLLGRVDRVLLRR